MAGQAQQPGRRPALVIRRSRPWTIRGPVAQSPLRTGGVTCADAAALAAGGACYQQWGWPVTLHRDQVQLNLHREVSALAIPVPLGTKVTEILARRRCAPPVLAHPYIPDYRIVLTGERYGALLPPTVTLRGSITWTQPPQQDSLRLCREIDLFGRCAPR